MDTRGLLQLVELSLHVSFLEIQNWKKYKNNINNLGPYLKFSTSVHISVLE